MKTKIKDIAKMANVSVTTVSLVLNNRKNRISTAKKQEIFDLVKKFDYVPNFTAKNLVSKISKTIGVLIPDIENFFFSGLVKVVEDIARQHDYSVIISNSNDLYENDLEIIKNFIYRDVDGLLITVSNEAYAHRDEMIDFLNNLNKPYVLMDRIFKDIDCHKVSFDNRLGGYLATQYLIDKGYKHIACVTLNNNSKNAMDRLAGYKDALKQNGIDFCDDYVFRGEYKFRSGYDLADSILAKREIEAVVASNDLVAYGIIKRARENGFNIPDDLSIVGYDNLEFSKMLDMHFPSVEQNVRQLGAKSVEILLEAMNGKALSEIVVFKPELKIN